MGAFRLFVEGVMKCVADHSKAVRDIKACIDKLGGNKRAARILEIYHLKWTAQGLANKTRRGIKKMTENTRNLIKALRKAAKAYPIEAELSRRQAEMKAMVYHYGGNSACKRFLSKHGVHISSGTIGQAAHRGWKSSDRLDKALSILLQHKDSIKSAAGRKVVKYPSNINRSERFVSDIVGLTQASYDTE